MWGYRSFGVLANGMTRVRPTRTRSETWTCSSGPGPDQFGLGPWVEDPKVIQWPVTGQINETGRFQKILVRQILWSRRWSWARSWCGRQSRRWRRPSRRCWTGSWCWGTRLRAVSPARVKNVAVISAPDNHFAASPDHAVKFSVSRSASGVCSCPTVSGGGISAARI